MGYRTDFVLSIEDGEATQQDLDQITEMLDTYENFEFWGGEWLCPSAKWYDFDKDMCKLSKAFPHLRFYVHGDGDDSDDLWEDHWQDGRVQHCYAEIPPFDPLQMSEYYAPEQALAMKTTTAATPTDGKAGMKYCIQESGSSDRDFDNLQDFLKAIADLASSQEENGEAWFTIQAIID